MVKLILMPGMDGTGELFAPLHRERRCHADVMQRALVVVQAEQQ
jgi:hypothetical protein